MRGQIKWSEFFHKSFKDASFVMEKKNSKTLLQLSLELFETIEKKSSGSAAFLDIVFDGSACIRDGVLLESILI